MLINKQVWAGSQELKPGLSPWWQESIWPLSLRRKLESGAEPALKPRHSNTGCLQLCAKLLSPETGIILKTGHYPVHKNINSKQSLHPLSLCFLIANNLTFHPPGSPGILITFLVKDLPFLCNPGLLGCIQDSVVCHNRLWALRGLPRTQSSVIFNGCHLHSHW